MAFNFALDNKAMPLKLRKNIKEQGENVLDDFMATIKSVTGVAFAFQVHGDVLEFNKSIGDYENRLGDIFFGSSGIMQSLVECLTTGCRDEMNKEALSDACTAQVLAFRVNLTDRPSGAPYHPIVIENGILFVDFYASDVWSNVSEVAYTKISDFPGIAGSTTKSDTASNGAFDFSISNKSLPLKFRQNLKEQGENVLDDFMATIKSVTGVAFAFQVHGDVLGFNKSIGDYENRLGDIFFGSSGIMQSLVECLTKGCADEMIQEALQDACSANLLAFRVNLTDRPSGAPYHPLSVQDGILFVDFYKDAVWTNVSEVACTNLEDMPGM